MTPEPTSTHTEKKASVWILTEVVTDKASGEVKHTKQVQLTTGQVSRMRIAQANGKQLYDFRHGKPLRFELEDVFCTMTLTRPNFKGGNNEPRNENN